MKQRILTGSAIFAVLLLSFLFRELNNLIFDALIVTLSVLCVMEINNILTKSGKYNCFFVEIFYVLVSQVCLVITMIYKLKWSLIFLIQLAILVLFAIITFIIGLLNTRKLKQEMAIRKIQSSNAKYSLFKTLNTLFTFIYPSTLLSLFIVINHISVFSAQAVGNLSLFLLLITLLIPVFTDIFAMLTGMIFGGRKLCPKISPNKTVSGAIGGLLWGVIGSVLAYIIFNSIVEFELIFTTINFKLWHFIVLGLIGSLFSQIGDIFESYLKRKANMKDSGDSLPGHGGYLDRIDSHLFNVLVIFIFCIIIL